MSGKKYPQTLMMKFPTINDLEKKAEKRLPFVAWAYLQTGTGSEKALDRNRDSLEAITLVPQFLKGELKPETKTQLFGRTYQAPFGIAPVGLSGLMWPKAEIILAKTANKFQIPFSLSTVATQTPETVGPHVGNMGWFQLYPPRDKAHRVSLLKRAKQSGFHTLLVTADVPTPSRRERTKRAGLQMPPKITPRFLWQGFTHPRWSLATIKVGLPRLRTIEAYSEFESMMSVSAFVQHELRGNLSWDYLQALREEWKGPLVLKGILHPEDALKAVAIGVDGLVVSNHGGRQFDAAPAAIEMLPIIAKAVKGKTAILFDSGVRSGLDVMRAIAQGADFVLLGRAFYYGVAALGKYGGDHVVEILLSDLKNNMVQLGVETIGEIQDL